MNKGKRGWRVAPCQQSHGEHTVVVDSRDTIVCKVPSAAWNPKARLHGHAKGDRRNLRLIAQAPAHARAARRLGHVGRSMLEQLEAALHYVETPGDFGDSERAWLQQDLLITIRQAKRAGLAPARS